MRSLGNGSGFSKTYTSAYFTHENDLIIIDMGDTAYHRLQKMDLTSYNDIYIFITHTHFDHVGGLPIFAQFVFYVLGKTPIIVAPSKEVKKDLSQLLKIGDLSKDMYKLKVADEINKDFFVTAVKTYHSPGYIKDKCFGYVFFDNGIHTIYTGDTSTIEPFRPYITDTSSLYIDVSAHYGKVHLKFDEVLDELKNYAKNGTKIYLMHLDDRRFVMNAIKDIKNIYVF